MGHAKIHRILGYGVVFYFTLIVASFIAALTLPDWRGGGLDVCYWTNKSIIINCGPDVALSEFREFFYNFWVLFLGAPMVAVSLSPKAILVAALLYAPVWYGLGRLIQRVLIIAIGPKRVTS